MPGSQRSQSREPAVLRTTSISPRSPARTPNLESSASPSRPAGGLTFHVPYIHHTAREGTSHRVSFSQLCAQWGHTIAQTDLAAPVLGLLMTEGHFVLLFCWLFTVFFLFFLPVFLKTRLFCDEQWSCFVLNLIHFWKKKKRFIIVKKYLHSVVLWKGSGDCLSWRLGNKMGWSGEKKVLELLSKFPYVAHFDAEELSLR